MEWIDAICNGDAVDASLVPAYQLLSACLPIVQDGVCCRVWVMSELLICAPPHAAGALLSDGADLARVTRLLEWMRKCWNTCKLSGQHSRRRTPRPLSDPTRAQTTSQPAYACWSTQTSCDSRNASIRCARP